MNERECITDEIRRNHEEINSFNGRYVEIGVGSLIEIGRKVKEWLWEISFRVRRLLRKDREVK